MIRTMQRPIKRRASCRYSRVRIYEGASRLKDRRGTCVQLVVSVQEEKDVKSLLKDRIRHVVLLAGVVELIEESASFKGRVHYERRS